MAKPVILAVDDDPQVLRAVERDLKRNYAREYRVLRADSGASALDALDRLKVRGDPVAKRSWARLLPPETLGPARGAPLPHPGRPARRVALRLQPAVRGYQGRRRPLVARLAQT